MKLVFHILVFLGCSFEMLSASADAQQEDRVYQRQPFDRITLDAENENAVLEVLPLDFPGRRVPVNPSPKKTLRIRIFPDIEREYEVAWKNIDKLELFERIVLSEATKLVERKNYDIAYDYFVFLLRHYPKTPGLDDASQVFLWSHAHEALQSGRLDEAYALLAELRQLNSSRSGLEEAITRVVSSRIAIFLSQDNFYAARMILKHEVERNPQEVLPELRQWQQKFLANASEKKVQAVEHLAAGRFREATEAAKKMMDIWPDIAGGHELSVDIARNYPMVVVGVSQIPSRGDPNRIDHWAARRVGRLMERRLVEITGYGSEGSEYFCPLGKISSSQSENSLILEMSTRNEFAHFGRLSGYEVSRHVLSMDAYSKASAWRAMFSGVSVEEVFKLRFHMRRSYVRPEALLRSVLLSQVWQPSSFSNPYLVVSQNKMSARFVLNNEYFLQQPKQPREIVERLYEDPREAIQALRKGEIDVLDKVVPSALSALSQDEQFQIHRYAVPAVHVLIPNYLRPLPANRNFRRAFVYGINRQVILDQVIFSKNTIQGCRVISGPFPAGASRDDPLAYAYNEQVKPRPYEPSLALTLAKAARKSIHSVREPGSNQEDKLGNLVIGHPASPVPRLACRAIAKYLEAVGFSCSLKELVEETNEFHQECDFVYTELYISEPIYDATLLLGPQGIVQSPSRYLHQAVEKLLNVSNWRESRAQLNQLHKIVYDEVAVIPLWQLIDHFAYHPRVQGIGKKPVSLYQSVEQWQISP